MSRGSLSASRFSDRIIAIPRMIAILANSDGCSDSPPGNRIQAWAPLIVLPSGDRTTIRPRIEAPQRIGV